ncbi:J domain-containing protein [Vibrio sp. 404]|uniref:J domain-containing protein n=1 Tax=Vibrio marinisediminis TaxID=2758441 RepID=A0A7W2FRL7_9VIBR|nr:tetratricopeptide repeat protein [Vibrio marinisediminis]MBA5763016.1 J domain-containing protein [Vibrio marinisediminis]
MMKFVSTLLFYVSSLAFANTSSPSFSELLAQAELDNPRAQYQVSQAYQQGSEVEKSNQEAFYWLEQAAQNRYKPAQYDLVAQYLNGGLTKPNLDNALYWLTKLAISGDDKAQFELGQLYQEHQLDVDAQSQAKLWYHVAAESNPAAEEAYAALLEAQFNQQRAKQLAQMNKLDSESSETQNDTSFWSSLPYEPQLALATLLVVSLTASSAWLWRRKKQLAHLDSRREALAITDQTASENQQLKTQIAKQDRALKKQKQQLELLYQQLKKHQATVSSASPVRAPASTPLSIACAMFGFEEKQIPDTSKIKQRYKQLCKIYHPDLKGSDEEMKRLNHSLKIILERSSNNR